MSGLCSHRSHLCASSVRLHPCSAYHDGQTSRHSALPTSDPDDELDSNKLALLSDRGEISQRKSNSSGQLSARDDPPTRSRRE
jgi:hypothetical protein